MYTIKVDGKLLYSPALEDQKYKVLSPKLQQEVNTAGSLSFVIPPSNACYDAIRKMISIVTVEQDGEEIFRGRVLEDTTDFYNQKEVYCEGELSFLLDSLQMPFEFSGTAAEFFAFLLNRHNAQVDECKQFALGIVSAVNDEDVVEYGVVNYSDTSSAITTFLLDVFGGYLRTRYADGVHYLDYIDEFTDECSQNIEFGINLLDITSQMDAQEIFTVLIPLGATQQDGKALTVESVNDGVAYIENAEGIAQFGRIWKTYTWDQVNDPEQLLELGNAHLLNASVIETLTLQAVDLHLKNVDTEKIRLGYAVNLLSAPHRLERKSICAALEIELDNPENAKYTFGLPKETMIDQANATSVAVQAIGNSINEQHRWLTETNTALNINVEAINLIGHRTTQLEIDVDAAEAEIALKASQKSVDILGEKHTEVELRLDAAEGAIKAKADLILLEGYVKATDLETETLKVLNSARIPDLKALAFGCSGTANINTLNATQGMIGALAVGTLEGVECSWKEIEVVTGGYVNATTATTPPFYDANGNLVTGYVEYVKSVSFVPTKTKISYLGGA